LEAQHVHVRPQTRAASVETVEAAGIKKYQI